MLTNDKFSKIILRELAIMDKKKRTLIDEAVNSHRKVGTNSPILESTWKYIQPSSLENFSRDDWLLLDTQRAAYLKEERPKQALEMLTSQAHAATFGYQINNYEHCLQSATMAMKDGKDEETIVVSLFHDLGFITNNESHGEFSASFLRPYISEKNRWMLERHMYFQTIHLPSHPSADVHLREKWRGHEYFEYTAEWVRKYDIASVNPNYSNAPLSTFIPMVYRVFSNPKIDIQVPD